MAFILTANLGAKALGDFVVFDESVGKAKQMVSKKDTLIVITADHSHGFSLGGYSKRGTNILGLVDSIYGNKSSSYKNKDGQQINGTTYTVLAYANGPGALKEIRTRDLNENETGIVYIDSFNSVVFTFSF